jgi:outer membrane protein assembly factor BamB
MRALHSSLTVLGLLALVTFAILPSTMAEWPMDGADAAHSGEQQTPVIGPATQWEVEVNGELTSPPATAYGSLFLGTSDGYLKVLDEVDGRQLWVLKLGDSVMSTPLVESQTVYVPSGNTIYAVTIADKTVKWSFEAVGDLRGSPIFMDNLVYIGSEDKHIYALDKYTGALTWSLKLDDVVAVSPSATGLTLVVGTESGVVFGIHRIEGTQIWRTDVGSPVSTAACLERGMAILGTFGGQLKALEMEGGEIQWSFPPDDEPELDPILTTPVTSSGLVYFGSDGLYCLEVQTGQEVWMFETGDTVRGSPAIVDNFIVFGSYDGLVRCIDKTTANVVWRFRGDTIFRSGVSIDYDKAYVGGRDGMLYARSILNRQAPTINGPYNLESEAHDSVSFNIIAKDPEENLLTYNWDFGDGNTSKEASPLHEYPAPGEYTVTVTVSDGTKNKKHTITVTVHPFEPEVKGGDEEGIPVAIVAGAGAGAAIAIVLVLLLFLRRRGGQTEGLDERAPTETEDEPVLVDGYQPPADDGAPSISPEQEEISWEEGQ